MSWCFVCFYIPQKTLSTTSSISSSSRVPTSTPIDPQPSPKETKTLNLSHPEPSLKFPKKNWAKQSFTKADTTPNLQEYPSPRPPQNPSQPFFIFKYQPVIRIKKVKHFVPQQKPVWRNLSSQPGLRRDICCAGQIPQWVVNKVHDGNHDHDDEDDHDDSDDITTPTVVLDNHHHHQQSWKMSNLLHRPISTNQILHGYIRQWRIPSYPWHFPTLVRSCFPITLIKCPKCQKSQRSLF